MKRYGSLEFRNPIPVLGGVGAVAAARVSAPLVTSADYPAEGGFGAPGVEGQLTFSPGAPDDVRAYSYAWSGGRVETREAGEDGVLRLSLAPRRSGINVLTVQAFGADGRYSDQRRYQFAVRPRPAGRNWTPRRIREPADGVIADERPSADGLRLGGHVALRGHGREPGLGLFTGDGELVTAGPVLDTEHPSGFTVAAWVRLPSARTPRSTRRARPVTPSPSRSVPCRLPTR